MNRRILVVSDLDIWTFTLDGKSAAKVGNQSLYNTLLGFETAGWDVHLMTANGIHHGLDTVSRHITVDRINLAAQQPIRRYRQLRNLVEPGLNRILQAGASAGRLVPGELTNKLVSAGRESRLFGSVVGKIAPDRTESAVDCGPGSLFQPEMTPDSVENRNRWMYFQVEMSIRVLLRCMNVMPDVIYGHEIFGAPVAANVGRLLGIPSVSRFQGTLLGRWVSTPEVFQKMPVNCAALKAATDLIVMADDGTMGDRVLQTLGVDMSKVRFWINGQDKALVKDAINRNGPRKWTPDEPVRIFTASRLVNWKRVDRVLTVMSKLPANLPRWRLEIAGDGVNRPALEQMAKDYGITDRVAFLGPICHEEVLNRMVTSDIVVGMNEISNLSNSILEAMVAGRAVIAAAAGGTDHVVQDGVTGLLVPEDRIDSDGVEKMADLIAMPELRAELGDAAAKWSETGIRTWAERMQMEVSEIEKLFDRERLPLAGFFKDTVLRRLF